MTGGFNCVDVSEFCEQMKSSAIDRCFNDDCPEMITSDDVRYASSKVKSTVSKDDIWKLLEWNPNLSDCTSGFIIAICIRI